MLLKTCLRLALFSVLLTSCSSWNQLLDSRSSAAVMSAERVADRTSFLQSTAFEQTENAFININATMSAPPAHVSNNRSSVAGSMMQISSTLLENMIPLQFKYAIMMNESVEKISNILLYQTIDSWFGTRYHYGGTTKKGIDCSAFMQVLGSCVFGFMLPRTAKEQFRLMQDVARDGLKEGDFIFFNTRGGVSHVGMYLSNNKFVHSCTSNGVMISDLDESYWSARVLAYKRVTALSGEFVN